jgi:hypothetical protein
MPRTLPLRFIAFASWLAAMLSYLTLYFAAKSVNWDMEAMANPLNQITIGPEGANAIGWSMLCDAFGFYLLSVPAALYLWFRLKDEHPFGASLATVSGLGYILTGALGAGILSIVWPELIREYALADNEAARSQITALFKVITNTVYTGMWGRVEYFLCAVWWLGIGLLSWSRLRAFAVLSVIAGLASLLGNIGETFGVHVLAEVGLNVYLLTVPIWTAWVGVLAWKDRGQGVTPAGAVPAPS